jgi:rhombotail lipoprotein
MEQAMKLRAAVLLSLLVAVLPGCTPFKRTEEARNASSLVDFLYRGYDVPQHSTIPRLRTPLRVGLAFLPKSIGQEEALSGAQKEELLEQIRHRFLDRKFVSEIVIIPDYYLKTAHGFTGLEGVQRLYSIDLMALVSYDQVRNVDDNRLSLSYLTIVGAYIVKGNDHDVTTLVDMAVVDPATRSLVLRAGGTDTRHGSSTLIERKQQLRNASAKSFNAATGQLVENFDAALLKFEADVRSGKANVRVTERNPSPVTGGGGGSFSWAEALVLLLLTVAAANLRKARPRMVS